MKKNILIVTSEFPPQPGGIGNHAYNLANSLAMRGYIISVLTDNRSDDGVEELNFDKNLDFTVIRIRKRRNRSLMYLQRIAKLKALKTDKDVIIASGKFSLWGVAFLSERKKVKNLAVIHGTEVNLSNPLAKLLVKLSLQSFDRLIAVSNYTQNLIPTEVRKRSIVIPNGYNNLHWKNLHSAKIKSTLTWPKLVTVGNVNYRKGQQNVIEKLPDLLKYYPDAEYHIIGLPTKQEEFIALAKHLGVNERITFFGTVPQEKVVNAVSKADIFVMLSSPSTSGDVEGFGIAVIEANALGLPAIGSKDCGIEDSIDDGISGILVDYKNTASFCNAVSKIAENYDKFSKGARSWANKHRWDKIVEKYVREIEQ